MFKRKFEKINADISILGFGCMRFPTQKDGKIDRAEAKRIVHYAIQNGVNYIDTAYMYHDYESESAVGEILAGVDRKSYYLADKMPGWGLKNVEQGAKIFEKQLQNCRVDYFDFYLCHALDEGVYPVFKNFMLDFLIQKKKEGKLKRLGFSFHGGMNLLKEVLSAYDWDFAQIQYNYFDYADFSKAQYDLITEKNIPIIIMEPVRGGSLASLSESADAILKAAKPDSSIASWAMRFAVNPENVLTVLSGMSNFEQVKDNINIVNNFTPLTESELKVIDAALKEYKTHSIVPCTKCRYCMDCPSGVDIPQNFAIYNEYCMKRNNDWLKRELRKIGPHFASQCTSCGVCKEKCPQKIDIPEKLSQVAKLK